MTTEHDSAANESCDVAVAQWLTQRLRSSGDHAEYSYVRQSLGAARRRLISSDHLHAALTLRQPGRDSDNALAAALRAMSGAVVRLPAPDVVEAIHEATSRFLRDDMTTMSGDRWDNVIRRLESAATSAKIMTVHPRGAQRQTAAVGGGAVAPTPMTGGHAAHLLFDRAAWLPTSPLWGQVGDSASEHRRYSFRAAYVSETTLCRVRQEYQALAALCRTIDEDRALWGWAFDAWRRPGTPVAGRDLRRSNGNDRGGRPAAAAADRNIIAVPPPDDTHNRAGPWAPDETKREDAAGVITPASFLRVASTYRDRVIQHTCRWLGIHSRSDFLSCALVTMDILAARAKAARAKGGDSSTHRIHREMFCTRNPWTSGETHVPHFYQVRSMSHLNLVTMIEITAVWNDTIGFGGEHHTTAAAAAATIPAEVYVHRILGALWRVIATFDAAQRGALRLIHPIVHDAMRPFRTSAPRAANGGTDSGDGSQGHTIAQTYPPLYVLPTASFRVRDNDECDMDPIMDLLAHYADDGDSAETGVRPTEDTIRKARDAAWGILGRTSAKCETAGESRSSTSEETCQTEDIFAWVAYCAADALGRMYATVAAKK